MTIAHLCFRICMFMVRSGAFISQICDISEERTYSVIIFTISCNSSAFSGCPVPRVLIYTANAAIAMCSRCAKHNIHLGVTLLLYIGYLHRLRECLNHQNWALKQRLFVWIFFLLKYNDSATLIADICITETIGGCQERRSGCIERSTGWRSQCWCRCECIWFYFPWCCSQERYLFLVVKSLGEYSGVDVGNKCKRRDSFKQSFLTRSPEHCGGTY